MAKKDINATDGIFGGSSILHHAVYYGLTEIVRYLIDKESARVDIEASISLWARKRTPLSVAAQEGHTEIVRFLINKGADVNAIDSQGLGPLHYAAVRGHVAIVRMLIKKGAEVNDDSSGGTPLHAAADNGHTRVVGLLLRAGAKVNARKKDTRETPLHLAASSGYTDTSKMLIVNGAWLNARDRSDISVLQVATFYGKIGVVRLLVKNGANVNQVIQKPLCSMMKRGDTAMKIAVRQDYLKIEKILRDAGGK